MASRSFPIIALGDMIHGQEADTFVLMTTKEELITRDGKKYFRVGFRDARREVTFPIWGDAPLAEDCRRAWSPGAFYKVRAVYRDTSYGPQLEIARIRETVPADEAEGFSPAMCLGAVALRSGHDVRRSGRLGRDAHRRPEPGPPGAEAAARQPRGALGPTRRDAESPCLCRRMAGACSECRPHRRVPGRQIRRALSRSDADALEQRFGRGRCHPLHDIGKLEELETSPTGRNIALPAACWGMSSKGRDMVRAAADEIRAGCRCAATFGAHHRLAPAFAPSGVRPSRR